VIAYNQGKRIAEPFIRGCEVVSGKITKIGEVESEPVADPKYADQAMRMRKVEVAVEKGEHTGKTVEFVSFERPPTSKTGLGPWVAWQGVELKEGAKILIIRWKKEARPPVYAGKIEAVAFASTDAALIPKVEKIQSLHARFKEHPELAGQIPQQFTEEVDLVLLGYAVAYLSQREAARNAGNAVEILTALVGNKRMPDFAVSEIVSEVVSNFYVAPVSVAKTTTGALVKLAADNDEEKASAAFSAFSRLADGGMLFLKPHLDEETKKKLIENYRSLRAKAKIPKANSEIESQIGIGK
jgi:hypothetical protein